LAWRSPRRQCGSSPPPLADGEHLQNLALVRFGGLENFELVEIDVPLDGPLTICRSVSG
jgi:hypothetical protein